MELHEVDPLLLAEHCWPQYTLYGKQEQIVHSVLGDGNAPWGNDETFVPAGHMLGKDFITAMICVLFALTRTPFRIVTTSVDHSQLQGVLWGEIRRFVQESRVPLTADKGGPLVVNHMHIRKAVGGQLDGLSYLIGRVAARGEGMSGHHIAQTGDGVPRTLFVSDEASGVDPLSFEKATEWANRKLVIGNPYECANQFKWAVKGNPNNPLDRGGDVPREGAAGYHRKVIQIRGVDSPNVQLGLAERANGKVPTGRTVIPGVLPYHERERRLRTWDKVKLTVGDAAEFYEGAEILMFPADWLNRAEEYARSLVGRKRKAQSMGIDPGEGGANTAWVTGDEHGVIKVRSFPTPDTAEIIGLTKAFAVEDGLCNRQGDGADRIVFDRGGGGKQAADYLRQDGWNVRTVGFGESVGKPDPTYARDTLPEQKDMREDQYAYVSRRVQMYHELSLLLAPDCDPGAVFPRGYWDRAVNQGQVRTGLPWKGFAMPLDCPELRRQLAPIPRMYDREGRLTLPPKGQREKPKDDKVVTLIDLIGCSPDEADATVLMVYGMLHPSSRKTISVW